MKATVIIANRFREVILNGTWIANTNFKDQLVDTNWELVTTKIDSLNTIAVLAQHIHYCARRDKCSRNRSNNTLTAV